MYNITEIEVIIANHEITLNTTYVYHLHTGEFINGMSRVQSPVNGTSRIPGLALNIEKGNTGSFSRIKIRKACNE